MEVAAGFAEHVDVQVGRLVDELDALGYDENTLVFYIWGDNGSSGEGQNGTISELLAQNGIPTTVDMHIAALDQLGGLDVLGSPLTDNQYHAGWAWAGSAPYKGMKLLASHLGGTRNPMAVRWPARITPDPMPRAQFHHCNDVVPTIYEILGITPPRVVNGVPQDPIDGVSFAYAIDDAARRGPTAAPSTSRSWAAAPSTTTAGWPRRSVPGCRGSRACRPASRSGHPTTTRGSSTTSTSDWSQAHDLAADHPDKVAAMRELFAIEAARNRALPIGGGLWIPLLHPEQRITPPYTEWDFVGGITRMPEFCAPALGNKPNTVTLDVDLPDHAERCALRARRQQRRTHLLHRRRDALLRVQPVHPPAHQDPLHDSRCPPGRATIEVTTTYAEPRPGGPLDITLNVDGDDRRHGQVPISAPLAVHRQRLPRHRHLPRLTRLARLPRPGAVPVQRHDPPHARRLPLSRGALSFVDSVH